MTRTEPSNAGALRELRRWHLGGGTAAPLPADAVPLLLAPFRDPARVRHDYPLVLRRVDGALEARPLGDLLPEWLAGAKTQARVLVDNSHRLERRVRLQVAHEPDRDARELLREAGAQMLAEMQLHSEVESAVRADYDAICAELPDFELLPLRSETALGLLQTAISQRVGSARAQFAAHVRDLVGALQALLQIEAQKDPAAHSAQAVGRSLGGAAVQFFDAGALARTVGPHRGTVRVDPARRARVQQALTTLESHLVASHAPECVVVASDAAIRFDGLAADLLATVRAARLAELERRGAYDPERHDALLAALGWQELTPEELAILPVVVMQTSVTELANHGLQSLMQLLVSGRPVQVLVEESPGRDPMSMDGAPRVRLELGYLGIACREAFVQQSTAARPAHLLRGFERALCGMRTGLHLVDPGLDAMHREPPLGSFLHAGAAIEGRAQPLFQYDPAGGETWARRLDFAGNPAPDADWPGVDGGSAAGGTQVFTFADYSLLEPHLRDAFALVPAELDSTDLAPIAAFLQLDDDAARRSIPFVVFVTGDGTQGRAAVRRWLVHACRDRLRYWRTLQELAGVRNEHVREAVQLARREAAEQATRERAALAQAHATELAAVREQATATAMQGLARMLLEIDPLGEAVAAAPVVLPRAATSAAPVAAAATAPTTVLVPAAAAVPAAVDEDDFDEPWIDSPRCSTCNDCVNLNSLMFVYDANKQARIADPRAGTYAQLVQAAEKCPSRCIHPGKPLNPDEPDLQALVARAAPFNT